MKDSQINNIPMRKLLDGLQSVGLNINEIYTSLNWRKCTKEDIKKLEDELDKCPQIDRKKQSYHERHREQDDFIMNFVLKNERFINKTALLTFMLRRLRQIDEKGANNESFNVSVKGKELIRKISNILEGANFKLIFKNVGQDGRINLSVISSDQGKEKNKNSQKLEKLGIPLINILNSIVLTDLADVGITTRRLGEEIRQFSTFNTALINGKHHKKWNDTSKEEIQNLLKTIPFIENLPEVEKQLDGVFEEIDFDKLVLCSAYRYIQFLDNTNSLSQKDIEVCHSLLTRMQSYLKNKKITIEGPIETSPKDKRMIKINYSLKDLEEDMKKFNGDKYLNKEETNNIRKSIIEGKTKLTSVDKNIIKLLNFSEKELITFSENDDNCYLFLIENGFIDEKLVNKINSSKKTIPEECIQALVRQKLITNGQLINLYCQNKIELKDLVKFSINLDDIFPSMLSLTEDKAKELYNAIVKNGKSSKSIEEKCTKQYLKTKDMKYIEVFYNLGIMNISTLKKLLNSRRCIDAFAKGRISPEFFKKMQDIGIVDKKQLNDNKEVMLKIWEDGKLTNEDIFKLGYSIETLLKMCDLGKIKGTRFAEIISKEMREEFLEKVMANYQKGNYMTIRPVLALYNSNIIDIHSAIQAIQTLKVSQKDLAKLCEEGLLSGEKIAKLGNRGFIDEKGYQKLIELGIVTSEEDNRASKEVTPVALKEALQGLNIVSIAEIEKILSKTDEGEKKDIINPDEYKPKYIVDPKYRLNVLKLLGVDTIIEGKAGFDGYQGYIVPRLGIIVVEKLYERNKSGKIKISHGNATYICKSGYFMRIANGTKGQARELIDNISGSGEVINHGRHWGENLIKAISQLTNDMQVVKENGKIKKIVIDDEEIDVDYKSLNNILEIMGSGGYDIQYNRKGC